MVAFWDSFPQISALIEVGTLMSTDRSLGAQPVESADVRGDTSPAGRRGSSALSRCNSCVVSGDFTASWCALCSGVYGVLAVAVRRLQAFFFFLV